MRYIVDFQEGDLLSGTYLCKFKQTLTTRAGKKYYSIMLQDKTGNIDGKVWDLSSGIDHFEAMDFIHIEAEVVNYQGSYQLNIRRIRKSDVGEFSQEDYMPTSKKDINEMYEELLGYVNNMQEPNLRALVSHFFVDDQSFVKKFKIHSAAKSIHHGFMGGLLEHTLAVVKACEFIADSYSIINKDLLIAAAMFHDMGKVDELSSFPENDYTDDGQLMGHIFIGANKISEQINKMEKFPKKLGNELIHCILAHHGELEYGSPKKPALAEAMALNFADNIDAKMQIMIELFESNEGKTEWLGYQKLFESNIRRSTKTN